MEQNQNKKPLKILCVDDEPEILAQVSDTIATLGYEVLKAPSVDEAVNLVKKEASRLVLILSDFSMEGKNGFDFRKEIIGDYKQIPFVLMSGHISKEDALKAVELKIAAFLAKPYQEEELLKIVSDESKDRVSSILDDDELLNGFIVDATGLIDEMEGLVLSLEENPGDVDAINRVFACAHTIKGASGFFKPDTVHRFTHRYEDFLSTFKKNPETLDSQAVSVLLKGLDVIKTLMGRLESGSPDHEPLETLTAIFSGSSQSHEPTADTKKKIEKAEAAPAQAQQPKKTEEIRVSIALLNDFMEKSGEITVLRNMINKVLRAIEIGSPSDPNVSILSELLSEMHKVISFMQDQLGDLRKVPLKQVYKPLSRTLRDLCVGLKKQIALETEGDDLRIDHTLADTLNKCLVHMLRNSADHGIETQEQRQQTGKSANGTIKISCAEVADEVIIRMGDDGRGIDPARIRSKAIEKGLVSAADAAKMPDAAIRMLIFEPGFSTAEQITDVSGRGVGTDMVKTTITSMGGRIQLDSEIGKGTVFTLSLPVPKSVLIINSLMIRASNQVFAIPQDKIVRVVRVYNENKDGLIMKVGDTTFFQDGDRLVPIVSLQKILQLATYEDRPKDSTSMVVMQSKNGNYCLQVDDILDSEEIVVKKFGKWFNQINGYMGATFLGDGKIGLILDADGIGAKANLRQHVQSVQDQKVKLEESQQSLGTKMSLLLFDVGNRSKYAVKQSEIFRLEELKSDQIQHFGDQTVVIYRNQTMPILPVLSLLEGGEKDFFKDLKSLVAIIVHYKERYFAFAVKQIGDFVEKENSVDEISFDGFSQTCIVQNQTVTVLRLDHFLSREWRELHSQKAA